MYDLTEWMEKVCSELRRGEVVLTEEQVADIVLAGNTFDIAKELQQISLEKR